MRIPFPTLTFLVALAVTVPAHAADIGIASAVKNQVTGTLAGKTASLSTGNSIFQNQKISTGADSAAQLLFLDETSLALGPNSDVTLDRFIYNPAKRTGDIVLQTGKGVFRFVTGSADPKSYSLKTPSATIGFRGSIADIIGNPLTIICVEATIEVILPDGTTIVLHTPGQAVTIDDFGTVTGPYTWNGDYDFEFGGLSFPLYADGFPGDPHRVEIPDGSIHILDEKNSENPPPCDCLY